MADRDTVRHVSRAILTVRPPRFVAVLGGFGELTRRRDWAAREEAKAAQTAEKYRIFNQTNTSHADRRSPVHQKADHDISVPDSASQIRRNDRRRHASLGRRSTRTATPLSFA